VPRPLVPDRTARILDAAERLVLEHGFDRMSVSAVAAAAGIGKGAVYLEFASKHDILDAVLRRATERMSTQVSAEVGVNPRLSDAYRASARALLGDPLMTAAFLDDRGVLGARVDTVTDGRYRERHRGVIAWIEDLQDLGAISHGVNAADLGLALSSATIGLLTASRLLGPLTSTQLEGAISALGLMVTAFEEA
jgi:AcrR family transcriptional regulator